MYAAYAGFRFAFLVGNDLDAESVFVVPFCFIATLRLENLFPNVAGFDVHCIPLLHWRMCPSDALVSAL